MPVYTANISDTCSDWLLTYGKIILLTQGKIVLLTHGKIVLLTHGKIVLLTHGKIVLLTSFFRFFPILQKNVLWYKLLIVSFMRS